MKKVLELLKPQVKAASNRCNIAWHETHCDLEENDIEYLRAILLAIKNKTIKIQPNGGGDNTGRNQNAVCEDTQINEPKKRGRRPKASTLCSETRRRSESVDCKSLNDSIASTASSTSSSRSRRAAAQAAEQKLAQVQSLVQLNTKLRRPTDFDEKVVKAVSSPPSKCRRTQRNQSAGSSSSQTNEVCDVPVEADNEPNEDGPLNSHCLVYVSKLNTPTIKSYTDPSSRTSKSLDRASKRKSQDLFNDSFPLAEAINKTYDISKSDPTHKTNNKKRANSPIAHSSPISLNPTGNTFKGFDDQFKGFEAALERENIFTIGIKNEETKVLIKKTLTVENEDGSSEESEQIEASIKSRTKILKKKVNNTTLNIDEKENVHQNNETYITNNNNAGSETKVNTVEQIGKSNEKKSGDSDSQRSPEANVRSRTKTIRKHNDQRNDLKPNCEAAGQSLRSSKRIINKDNAKEDQSDSTDNESSNVRSRTKTIRKGPTNVELNGQESEYSISEFKVNKTTNKARLLPASPAPVKGELVKKRIEDFEKMQSGLEECEEENPIGRVTRNALKSKVTASTTEGHSSKQPKNVPLAKLQAKLPLSLERPRMTPLGVNNRMTPSTDSAHKLQANKLASSATRQPADNGIALIQKQNTEEAEKKKKEEERLKRQTKEEEAKRKKEKVLKATAEEARRKRVEKLKKVAATREAAEKEKERLAAIAEKEKEEKMRLIATEKEKQKEEQLKKKQLMQQKALEHEERRKQEEAGRLAKIQEEEHKRLQALKERELELQKQHKAELRLAETEKAKQQGGKLGKIAAINNAKLKLQQGTPAGQTNTAQSENCYEITPAREDRPLLPPKTENDYGIDDANSGDSSEDESQPKKMIPVWAQSKNRERLLLANKYIPKKLWEMFMECDPCPDINKIFAGNPIKRRIRTSSAVWRTPPKYSRVAP